MKKIETTEKDNPTLYMAPMAGVTDRAFREITTSFGADLCFTEMVNVKGLYYKDAGTDRLLDMGEEEEVGIQIFGRDVEIIEMIIYERINNLKNIKILDFNLGCPAPKIFKNKEGSYLLNEPDLVGKILETMVRVSNIPVTAKIRLGVDEDHKNYLEIAKICEQAGVTQLTVHGRTRDAYYAGDVDLEAIKEIKGALKIPVIGNGNIFTSGDAIHMLKYTGCDAVMIARGALGNPFLFKEIKEALKGNKSKPPTFVERKEVLLKHYEKISNYKPERITVTEMRKHAAWYLKGLPRSNVFKNKINTASSMDEVLQILEEFES